MGSEGGPRGEKSGLETADAALWLSDGLGGEQVVVRLVGALCLYKTVDPGVCRGSWATGTNYDSNHTDSFSRIHGDDSDVLTTSYVVAQQLMW